MADLNGNHQEQSIPPPAPAGPEPPPRATRALASIARNSIANLARQGASWLVVLLLPPLLVRVLDKPSYATWVLMLQIAAYVGMFDGGVQNAIARFVARAEGLSDQHYMERILSSAGLILVIASALAMTLTSVVAWKLDAIFHGIPSSVSSDAKAVLLLVGFSMALSLPFSTMAGIFAGLQKNEVNAIAGSVGKISGAIGAGWAAYHHQGLMVMGWWVALGNLLQPLIYFVSWRRLTSHIRIGKDRIDLSALKEFFQFWSAMLIAQFGTILITGLDMPIVVAFDFPSAAYYAVATTISNMLVVPYSAIISTLMPVAAGMSVGDSAHRLGEIVVKTTRYGTAILCLMAIPLTLGIYPFLRLWVGADYAGHALPLAEVLIAAQLIRLTLNSYATIAFSAGQQNRILVSPFVEGVVNLIASLVAVQYIGAIGVALGTLLGACVGLAVHFVISMPRTDSLAFSRRRLFVTGILWPVFYALPPVLFIVLLGTHTISSWTHSALVAVGELIAAWLLWKFNFDEPERGALKSLLRHVASFAKPA